MASLVAGLAGLSILPCLRQVACKTIGEAGNPEG